MLAQQELHERQGGNLLLAILFGLRENGEVPLIADAAEPGHRNGIGNASIEKFPPADTDNPRDERHGRRSAHPLDVFGIPIAAAVVDRLPGRHVGADDVKFARILGEGRSIERIEDLGKGVIAELLSVEVSGLEELTQADVTRVAAIGRIVAQHPSDLVRLVVAAKDGTGRDADKPVKLNFLLHEDIKNPSGVESPHASAFQHQSLLHAPPLQTR